MDLKFVKAATEAAYQNNWRELPIVESGEPLVKVDQDAAHSWYCHEMGLTDDQACYLREGVYAMFNAARRTLQGVGYDLKVYDGWRPVALQETLFWYYMKLFTVQPFGLEELFSSCQDGKQVETQFLALPPDVREALMQANRQYVSWPSTDAASPSPHATGGSVDVWLFQDDKPVDLGVPFDWMEANAGAFYHLEKGAVPWPGDDQFAVNFHRELLLRTMVTAGFSCYPYEIWHFNYGNQMDAVVSGKTARYGYIEP